MLEQPQTGLISRFFRQVENRLKNDMETVCTTQKTQGDPLYDGAENTCLIGF